ncbi:MAG: hypothetical protein DBY34_07970 [Oscillospiraceae bacterium]|uniref:hypothetical protein n=1 Tax=Merdimmobilis hominis TaxID=2897707 RepID=UPI0006C79412|nr:hypothetical protein [Merdimmobilis hominis]PWL57996.1 MAG: hypothetical protein DBY34_07970 [Oscillospiraceae bacterium]
MFFLFSLDFVQNFSLLLGGEQQKYFLSFSYCPSGQSPSRSIADEPHWTPTMLEKSCRCTLSPIRGTIIPGKGVHP